MKYTAKIHNVALSEIQVDREKRQRRELEVESLARSIAQRGLMNPIILERRPDGMWLVAGERRLEATRLLDYDTIQARYVDELTPLEHQTLEFEENVQREDISWQEKAQAVGRIHALLLEQNPSHTVKETAEHLAYAYTRTSELLTVLERWDLPQVREATSMREARNFILRLQDRSRGAELAALLETTADFDADGTPRGAVIHPFTGATILPSPIANKEDESDDRSDQGAGPEPGSIPLTAGADPIRSGIVGTPDAAPERVVRPAILPGILCEDALAWMESYSGPKFNFIHCDFPYGINVFSGPQGREGGDNRRSSGGDAVYDDSPDVYFQLLEGLIRNYWKLATISSHLMFWYSERHRERTLQMFREKMPEMKFNLHPLIWMKTDNAGIASDARRTPRHIYETALMGYTGDRKIVRIAADAFASPTDKTLHVSTKPEPMLKHFFQLFVDETTRLLDPTCGSGAAIRAADALGAQFVLGLERDPDIHSRAAHAYHLAMRKKSLSKLLSQKEQRDAQEAAAVNGGRTGITGGDEGEAGAAATDAAE